MHSTTRVVQISDLHFVEDLSVAGKRMWARVYGPKSHAFAKAKELAQKIDELHDNGVELSVFLFTGDLTTCGTSAAMETARRFIEDKGEFDADGEWIAGGLNVPVSRRIVIPGNHDRYCDCYKILQEPNSRLEQSFQTGGNYPYVRAYRAPADLPDPSAPTLVFFAFDSTLSGQDNLEYGGDVYRIARGRIRDDQLTRFREAVQRLDQERTVVSFDGDVLNVSPEAVIRIAVIHHHPVDPKLGWDVWDHYPPRGRMASQLASIDGTFESFLGLTVLENASEFVAACVEARVDLTLFGHQHLEFENYVEANGHLTHFICCPTATEFHGAQTGFYVWEFDSGEARRIPFRWNRTTFVVGEAVRYPYRR